MTTSDLAKIVQAARCKIIGWEDAGNSGHRLLLASIIRAFDNSESAILCEPSLAQKTVHPPDAVLIDVQVGVHVFEVKGMPIDQIDGLEVGGLLRIRYSNGVRSRNAVHQVRSAMFDIKDATVRAFEGDVSLPFKYWVVFPLISRAAWIARFGAEAFRPPEFLFADDLEPAALAERLGATDRRFSNAPIRVCPLEQLQCVWRAFGDTSVLYASPQERPRRRAAEGTLGEQFDEAADAYKMLSEEQQRLSQLNFEGGPRLIRGVAGSGKTIVLANNLARRLERMLVAASQQLFEQRPARPRLLAVCFNRTLAPFIQKKIQLAFMQRNGRSVPEGMVDVCSLNSLMFKLASAGVWQYRSVKDAGDIVRAIQYLSELVEFRGRDPERLAALAYDAIYVDEGQDFQEQEFQVLKELCRVSEGHEPNLYVFYDDAQNLYGRGRPNWQSLGLNVRGGRSYVMTQCFRNTRQIVEPAFNVLYGTCAQNPDSVPTREFGDILTLEQKGLIRREDGIWRVRFTHRAGPAPRLTFARDRGHETELLMARLRWLIETQAVRPEDIQVLAYDGRRVLELAEAAKAANFTGVAVHVTLDQAQKDKQLGQPGRLTFSTVASAKGYDAYCVLLASADRFPPDVRGRASFYVACTRAIESLDLFASSRTGLAAEFVAALGRS